MIRLKNISTKLLIDSYGYSGEYFISKKNCKLIKKLDLTDLQQLKDYYGLQQIVSQFGQNELNFSDDIHLILENASSEIEKTNQKMRNPEVYETNDAIIVDGKVVMIRDADKNVEPYRLLYGSPFEHYREDSWDKIGYQPKKRFFITKDIATLKDLISHCSLTGQNAYSMYIHGPVDGHAKGILNALRLYEEQIARQIKSAELQGCDVELKSVFDLNREEKKILISEQYQEIAQYLSEQESFVWGEKPSIVFPDENCRSPEARLIYNSWRKNTFNARFNRSLLTNTIADYVTLEEAQDGLLKEYGNSKKKVIDRFVVNK